MERFTYSRTGGPLRTTVTMFCAMLMGDVVVFAVIAALVPGIWTVVTVVAGVVLVTVGYRVLTHVLRTAHELSDRELVLRFGRFRLGLPRETIQMAEICREPLPRGLAIPTLQPGYRAETDALYLLADRRSLVRLDLARPVEVRLPRAGTVQFARVVLSLDEPERLVRALGGGAEAGEVRVGQVRVGQVAAGESEARQTEAAGLGEAGQSECPKPTPTAPTPAQPPPPASPPTPPPAPAIRLASLTKRYGSFAAVRSLDLTVAPGEVLAFLGANGAGKTTTIKMMTGLLRPTAGTVFIGGQDLWAAGPAARRQLGYVPDVPLLYEGLTAREFLWLVAGLYDLPRPAGRQRAEELLALLQLERWGDHLIRSFSLGMKRKMAIAAALVHRPRVLLLDEVTNGLDPRAAREVKDLIAALARDGAAVFLTTHLLDVAGELAHRVGIIDRGELKALGTLAELQAQAGLPGAGLERLFLALTARTAEVGA